MRKLVDFLSEKDFEKFYEIVVLYMKKHNFYIDRNKFLKDDFCEKMGFYHGDEFMDISCKTGDDITFMDCCHFKWKLESKIIWCAYLDSFE